MSVPLPEEGETARIQKGALSLLLRRERGTLCLVTRERAQDGGGEREKRHYLGLPKRGELLLLAQAPEYRVRVRVRDQLTLAPGGRIRGYLAVPLPHRLVWKKPNGRLEPLLDVLPHELKTSWLGEGPRGGYIHEVESPFHLHRHQVRADTLAMVPVLLLNTCDHSLSPAELTLSLRDRDLHVFGGAIIASPRRLVFGDGDDVQETIRPLPRRSA